MQTPDGKSMKAILKSGLMFAAVFGLGSAQTSRAQTLPELWQDQDNSMYVDSCPAIDSNGVIYVTTSGGAKIF